MVEASNLYSTSVEDQDTTLYLLDFQEMRVSSIKMQKLEVDFLVSWHDAQTETTKDFTGSSLICRRSKKLFSLVKTLDILVDCEQLPYEICRV